jgi:hypothetical protein
MSGNPAESGNAALDGDASSGNESGKSAKRSPLRWELAERGFGPLVYVGGLNSLGVSNGGVRNIGKHGRAAPARAITKK